MIDFDLNWVCKNLLSKLQTDTKQTAYFEVLNFKDIIMEVAPCKKKLNFDVCLIWWCSDGPINSQKYKSFEIYAVTIKISMTEYHHWINGQTYHLF